MADPAACRYFLGSDTQYGPIDLTAASTPDRIAYLTPNERTLPSRPRPRRRHAAHVRDHLAPGRGQDDAHRKAAALRRRDPDGGHRQGAQERAPRDVGLDGGGKAARHLGDELGDAVRVRRPHDQPARHARPRGLLRGHLSRADRGRRGGHGDRRGQGCRGADDQAARGVPAARHADHHVRQQDGPRGARAAGAARGNRGSPEHRLRAGLVADRHGQGVSRRVRPSPRSPQALHARRGARHRRRRGDRGARQPAARSNSIRARSRRCATTST